jgi:hypothetical protein
MKILLLLICLIFSSTSFSAVKIVSQPTNTILRVGEVGTLSIVASSNRSIRYYWYRNGTMLSTKTKTLSVSKPITGEDVYSCMVTDGVSKANCVPFTVTVVTNGAIMFSWNKPTTREDGTLLKDGEIVRYKLYLGSLVDGSLTLVTEFAGSATEAVVYGFDPGTYYFSMTAMDSLLLESKKSERISVVVK